MAPPRQEDRDLYAEYRAGHIPNAVFSILKRFPDRQPAAAYDAASRSLRRCDASWGRSDKHLVVYDEGNLQPRAPVDAAHIWRRKRLRFAISAG